MAATTTTIYRPTNEVATNLTPFDHSRHHVWAPTTEPQETVATPFTPQQPSPSAQPQPCCTCRCHDQDKVVISTTNDTTIVDRGSGNYTSPPPTFGQRNGPCTCPGPVAVLNHNLPTTVLPATLSKERVPCPIHGDDVAHRHQIHPAASSAVVPSASSILVTTAAATCDLQANAAARIAPASLHSGRVQYVTGKAAAEGGEESGAHNPSTFPLPNSREVSQQTNSMMNPAPDGSVPPPAVYVEARYAPNNTQLVQQLAPGLEPSYPPQVVPVYLDNAQWQKKTERCSKCTQSTSEEDRCVQCGRLTHGGHHPNRSKNSSSPTKIPRRDKVETRHRGGDSINRKSQHDTDAGQGPRRLNEAELDALAEQYRARGNIYVASQSNVTEDAYPVALAPGRYRKTNRVCC